MNSPIQQNKIDKLLYKVIKKQQYSKHVDFINDLYKRGLSKNECMIVELLLLHKPYDRIKKVLLFTDNVFNEHINNINTTLKNWNDFKEFF